MKIEPAIKDLSKYTHALLSVKATTSPELKEKVEEGSKILEANTLVAEAHQKLYKGTSNTEFDEKVQVADETLKAWMSTVYIPEGPEGVDRVDPWLRSWSTCILKICCKKMPCCLLAFLGTRML